MKRCIFAVLVVLVSLAGCATAPRTLYQESRVWTIDKTRDDLMRSAVVGVFRVWQGPNAAMKYNSEQLGIIVSEGSVALSSGGQSGLFASYALVFFRLVIETRDGRARATVEDARTLEGYGLTAEQRGAFDQILKAMFQTLEAALREKW